jgi:ABC-type sugar transport system substrate-binding protein
VRELTHTSPVMRDSCEGRRKSQKGKKIWGLSLPSDNRQCLKDETVNGLILWNPAKLTYLVAKLANDYLDGKKPIDEMVEKGIGKLTVKRDIVKMPEIGITKDNADQFDF